MENGNDTFTALKLRIVVDATLSMFQYTRADVLTKLMEFAASAAVTFGPYSDEVADLESDIEEVKGGAPLADFGWCFPQMDEFVKAEVA